MVDAGGVVVGGEAELAAVVVGVLAAEIRRHLQNYLQGLWLLHRFRFICRVLWTITNNSG